MKLKLKPFDLVRLRSDSKKHYRGVLPVDDQFVYLGEITQMPGHGIFVVIGPGKVYTGYHIHSFELVPQET